MDLDGDGVLSMYELEHFYQEQSHRLEAMGVDPLPFHDLMCQVLDLVRPQRPGMITLQDLKRCGMAHVFYDTFFSLEKYLEHEQRDPFRAGREVSDWCRFAAEEYEVLVAEESESEHLEDEYNDPPLYPSSAIAPPLYCRFFPNASQFSAMFVYIYIYITYYYYYYVTHILSPTSTYHMYLQSVF
uniref:EF-hand domain-containing protein n=1 Tax=Paramormyrops kingsleyae TaxID=1676925 RepID=A0A3B3QZA4_9TELE